MAWLSDWKYRRKITIDSSKVDSALQHFPVLLKIGEEVGITDKDVRSIFTEVGTASKKIAITKSDGETEIYAEIERWDNTNKLAELWVSKSDLSIASDADTDLYIYYDSTKDDNTDFIGDTQSTPAKLVWDSDFKFRSDMKDKTTSTIEDSTSNANHGTKGAANKALQVDGQIAKAQEATASGDHIAIADHASLQNLFDGGGTVSVIFKLTSYKDLSGSTGGYARFVVMGEDNDHGEVAIYVTNVSNRNLEFRHFWSGPHQTTYQAGISETTGGFKEGDIVHFAVTYNADATGNKAIIYTYGVARTTDNELTPAGTRIAIAGEVRLHDNYIGTRTFDGWLDEVRFSSTIRTAAWIKAEYNGNIDSLIAWGDEESSGVNPNVSDQLNLTEDVSVQLSYIPISVSDQLNITEDTTALITELNIGVSDQLNITEDTDVGVEATPTLEVDVSDQLNITEDASVVITTKLIYTYADLKKVGTGDDGWNLDSDYKLMNDIDASASEGEGWTTIGNTTNKFTGIFNGQGYRISNLHIDTSESFAGSQGVFGVIEGGTVENLRVEGSYSAGGNYTGGIAGQTLAGSIIRNCRFSGSIITEEDWPGWFGGITGSLVGGTIERCYASGTITGGADGGSFHGGLVGYNEGTISNCYSSCGVSGDDKVGGLVGTNYRGKIYKSYSTGAVSGNSNVGGFCGSEDTGTGYDTQDNFFDYQTAGNETEVGATKKTTAEMKDIDTFTDTETAGLTEAWDMVLYENHDGEELTAIWWVDDELDYPKLWFEWEIKASVNTSDQLNITESVSLSPDPAISVSDQLNITEDVSIIPDLVINVSDQLNITEDTSLLITELYTSVSDQLNITEDIDVDVEALLADLDVDVSDQLNLTENISIAPDPTANVSDQINLTEDIALSVFADGEISVLDTLNITEDITVSPDPAISIFEELTVSEDASVTVETPADQDIDVFDQLNLTEDISAVLSDPNINVSDEITVSEDVSAVTPVYLHINVAEELTISEATSFLIPELYLTTQDNIQLTEDLTMYGGWGWKKKSSATWGWTNKASASWTFDNQASASWGWITKNI